MHRSLAVMLDRETVVKYVHGHREADNLLMTLMKERLDKRTA